jgi:hypothetical protein
MELLLTAISGLAWTVVYVAAIWIGFRHKTYAMPIAALGLNFAWEWIYTFFRFGRKELPAFVSRWMFYAWGIAIVGASFVIQLLFIGEFGLVDMRAAQYSAFLQNLLMSGLFIAMFVARRGARGQSLTIGIAKWLGTLAPTILFGVLQDSPFILGIGILCSVFDLAYVAMLFWARTTPTNLVSDARGGRTQTRSTGT